MKYNHYYCPHCKKNTYTRNEDKQVTPMFFTCRHCGFGMAESGFFTLSDMIGKSTKVKVTHEFYTNEKGQVAAREIKP